VFHIIYINSISLSICDGGFGGWGKGEAGEVAGERKIGMGLSIIDFSLPYPPRRAQSVEIWECRARSGRNLRVPGRVRSKSTSAGPGLFVTDLSLPTPHAGPGWPERRALSERDGVHYASGSH